MPSPPGGGRLYRGGYDNRRGYDSRGGYERGGQARGYDGRNNDGRDNRNNRGRSSSRPPSGDEHKTREVNPHRHFWITTGGAKEQGEFQNCDWEEGVRRRVSKEVKPRYFKCGGPMKNSQ